MSKRKYEPTPRTSGRPTVAMTIHTPAETHEKLRLIAAEKRTSLQQIVAAAVDMWLMRKGLPFTFYPAPPEDKIVLIRPAPAKPITKPSLYMSVEDAAVKLGVSSRFVHTMVLRKENPMPSIKLGKRRLIPIADCERWVTQQ